MSDPDDRTDAGGRDHATDETATDETATDETATDETATGRAVVDRVVEGLAVLLVGDDETEFDLPVTALPDGAGEGSVVAVRVTGTSVEVLGVDAAATAAAHERAAAQRDRLRGRSRRFGPRP